MALLKNTSLTHRNLIFDRYTAMNKEFLEKLREFAFYFKLEVSPKYGGAIDIDSLTRVLKSLNVSYQNYFDAELRNQYTGKITAQVDKEIRALKDEAKLLIVDLKFASFEAAISPDAATSSAYAYIKNPLVTKRNIFKTYENDVFFTNLNDGKTVAGLEKRFTAEERASIFKPLEDTLFHPTRYKFKFGRSFTDLGRSFKAIKPEFEKKLIPPTKKAPREETMYKMYVVTDGETDLFGPKPKIKKVFASEKLEQPTYPLQLSSIKDGGSEVLFKEPITADVTYEEKEKLYYISYPKLNILVWDEDRIEADEAFKFAFISLVQNIYNEDDKNLTKSAIVIKSRLAAIIDKIK